tara:strand:+ start:649 stop:888 length:240 start_codon:yes stop_codon:yes gene_type:complete
MVFMGLRSLDRKRENRVFSSEDKTLKSYFYFFLFFFSKVTFQHFNWNGYVHGERGTAKLINPNWPRKPGTAKQLFITAG